MPKWREQIRCCKGREGLERGSIQAAGTVNTRVHRFLTVSINPEPEFPWFVSFTLPFDSVASQKEAGVTQKCGKH